MTSSGFCEPEECMYTIFKEGVWGGAGDLELSLVCSVLCRQDTLGKTPNTTLIMYFFGTCNLCTQMVKGQKFGVSLKSRLFEDKNQARQNKP